MTKNIVICGYHGYDNCGDDAILQAILNSINERYAGVDFTVISGNPKITMEKYAVDSVYRFDLLSINKVLKKADVLLFGGGALLQDITSSRSLYYYLTILKMAQIHKVDTMVYANGMGPILRPLNRYKTMRCLNKVQMITLRDEDSAQLLKEIGVCKPEINVTADPVFCFPKHKAMNKEKLLAEADLLEEKKYVGIAIRSWKKADLYFPDKIAALCDELNEKYGLAPLFIPMQYEVDFIISKQIISKMKTKGYLIDRQLEIDEVSFLISQAESIIGMRLHSLIFATLHCVPCLALSYDPKIFSFMKSIEQPFCMDVEQIDEKELKHQFNVLMVNLPLKKKELQSQRERLMIAAEKNVDFLGKLF